MYRYRYTNYPLSRSQSRAAKYNLDDLVRMRHGSPASRWRLKNRHAAMTSRRMKPSRYSVESHIEFKVVAEDATRDFSYSLNVPADALPACGRTPLIRLLDLASNP